MKSENESETDERFYTPRAQASTARSTGSYGTPRSYRSTSVASSSSDGDQFVTPRNYEQGFQYSTSYLQTANTASQHGMVSRSERRNLIPPQHNKNLGTYHNKSASEANYFRFNHEDGADEESRGEDKLSSAKGCVGLPLSTRSYYSEEPAVIEPTKQDIESIFSLCRHGRIEAVAHLLQKGVNPDTRDENHGNSILSIACQNGNKRLVKLALRYGADRNIKNHRGNTPLHFCYKYGHLELGEYLITKGADKNIKNLQGQTCEDL